MSRARLSGRCCQAGPTNTLDMLELRLAAHDTTTTVAHTQQTRRVRIELQRSHLGDRLLLLLLVSLSRPSDVQDLRIGSTSFPSDSSCGVGPTFVSFFVFGHAPNKGLALLAIRENGMTFQTPGSCANRISTSLFVCDTISTTTSKRLPELRE